MTSNESAIPGSARKWLRVLFATCAVLVVADFVFDKHPHFGFEKLPLFHAWFGFAAFAFIVAVGALLRFVVARSEDYYERHNGSQRSAMPSEDAEVEPEAREAEDHRRV